MKLKPVVASLVMLGLMAPAFGKTNMQSQQAVVDQNSGIAPLCTEGWFNRISVGGFGSVVGAFGNHDFPGYFTRLGNSSDLFLNNFNLMLGAKLSSWSKATANIAYFGAPDSWLNNLVRKDSSIKANVRTISHDLTLDEAYVTIADLAKNPFYMIVGKKYVPFGEYNDPYAPYQIMSPTQMMAQINAVTAIAGVTSDFGFYASIFGFRGETYPDGSTAGNIRNFGAKIGYYGNFDEFNAPNTHFNANLSYVRNLLDSKFFSPNANPNNTFGSTSYKYGSIAKYEIDHVDGLAIHADLAYKEFSLSANWVTALKQMSNIVLGNTINDGAKLWAADVNADYAFKTFDHDSHLGAGFQWTGNGKFLGLGTHEESDWVKMFPKWRLLGEYKINLFKNTDLGLIVTHGKSYDFKGASDEGKIGSVNSTAGIARLMFQF